MEWYVDTLSVGRVNNQLLLVMVDATQMSYLIIGLCDETNSGVGLCYEYCGCMAMTLISLSEKLDKSLYDNIHSAILYTVRLDL